MTRTRRDGPAAQAPGWPDLEIESDASCEAARLFARALRDATNGWTLRRIEDATGVDDSVIARILSGKSWPDARTIARLEYGLEQTLWPGRVVGSNRSP